MNTPTPLELYKSLMNSDNFLNPATQAKHLEDTFSLISGSETVEKHILHELFDTIKHIIEEQGGKKLSTHHTVAILCGLYRLMQSYEAAVLLRAQQTKHPIHG